MKSERGKTTELAKVWCKLEENGFRFNMVCLYKSHVFVIRNYETSG